MLIDSHCHLPHTKYEKSVDEIINEAKFAGVEKFVNIGTSLNENKKAIQIAEKYENVFATIGIYPHENKDIPIAELDKKIRIQLNLSDKIVGIGECGFDITNWKNGRSPQEQKELFEMQIQLAQDYSLPLVIHNRNGDDLLFETLDGTDTDWLRGVSHCFSSTWETAQKFLDIGFYISFSANITYPSAKTLLETVKKVPLDRFIIETDSPYLPPQSHRGEPNYPKYVKIVAEKVAQVKQKPFEEICKCSYENTCRLFGFS